MIALNLIGSSLYQNNTLSGYELLIFSILAISSVVILLYIHNRIPKRVTTKKEAPLYNYKDVLLQEVRLGKEVNYIPLKTKVSLFTKLVILVLVAFVFFTPFDKLLQFI